MEELAAQYGIASCYSTKTQFETEIGYFWNSNFIFFSKLCLISRNGNHGGLTELIKNILASTLFKVSSDSFFLNSQPPEFQWSTWFSLEQWPTEQVGRLCWGGAPGALGCVLPVHLAVTCRRKQVQPISLLSRLLTPERSYIDFPLTQGH